MAALFARTLDQQIFGVKKGGICRQWTLALALISQNQNHDYNRFNLKMRKRAKFFYFSG
jgi:hypothetical protein